ncbi:MAG: tyrosine-type recombinase/integrase [Clostridia bacterium]
MSKKKTRQKRGTGGLVQKNGKFEGRYRLYRKNGTYIDKSFTRKTENEINDIKARLRLIGTLEDDIENVEIDKRTNEISLVRKTMTISNKKVHITQNIALNDYVDFWLWNYRKKGEKGKMVKDSTFEDYVQKADYIKKRLGTRTLKNKKQVPVRVVDLNFETMETAMLELYNDTCYTTALQVRNHLYNLMKYAKKDKIIEENPFEENRINFPDHEPKKERTIIKEQDIGKVIQYALKLWYIDVLTQLMTGARVSEIRGLIWEDINEEEKEISFSHNYSSVKQFVLDKNNHIISKGRKRRYSSLKSSSSYRTIKIDEGFMKILKIHKEMQKQLAKSLNKEFKETDPVFTTKTYNALGRSDTNDRVKKIVKNLEIENWQEITSHCLRHSFCYAGLLNDVPLEYMQILLGHSDISVTREWYAHFDKVKVDEYATKVNANRNGILEKLSKRYFVSAEKVSNNC